jgi:DNA ligase-1
MPPRPMSLSRRRVLISLLAAGVPGSAAFASGSASSDARRMPLPALWREGLDPASYLVSEKFDGARGYWDGTTLRFRSGRIVPAPESFVSRLPPTPLDGELWLGRSRFDELSGIVRRESPIDTEWRQVRYMVFELPGASGTFSERAQRIAQIAAETAWPQLVAVKHTPVADQAALMERLHSTVDAGGEGLVLHLAAAPYRVGRSDSMLKLKLCLDAEATVIAYRAGQGKYEGQMGAVEVRTPEGRKFMIGSGFNDEQRSNPPPIGSVITYRYRDLTSTGLPRFATFLRSYTGL